jgi:hypothetical protein
VPDPTTPITNGDADAAALEDDDDLLEAGEPDLDDVPAFDEPEPLPDEAAIDELGDDFGPDEVGDESFDFEPRPAAFAPAELAPRLAALEGARPVAGADDLSARLSRLEQAAQALVAVQEDRDGRRVRRKVSAASIGAFAAAAVPVGLDLIGALNLDPAITSTISAGAALVGAFAAGWVTPERQPSLPPDVLRP